MADERTGTYIAEVASRLELPEPIAGEILDELADHLADAVDALFATGVAPEEAERVAIDRLGPADELARELRRARQTRRRVLAGAAGGVWAAVGHGIGGTILGFRLVLAAVWPLAIAGAFITRSLNLTLDFSFGDTISFDAWNTVVVAGALAIGAFLAGRKAVLATASRSLRSVRVVGRWWALAGALVLTVWVLFVLRMALSWPAVGAELLVPLAFALGATARTDRPGPRLRTRTIVLVFLAGFVVPSILLVSFLGAATYTTLQAVRSGPYASPDEMWRAFRWDSIGRRPPDEIASLFTGETEHNAAGALAVSQTITAWTGLAGWRDFRFEAWRRDRDGPSIAAGTSAPFATVSATPTSSGLAGTLRVDRTPGVVYYALVLTAVGPDGTRYLVSGPSGGQTAFVGTIWDWLTAQ